ncbi:NAD(P)-dependent oxidoreductase [Sporichthya sp.]|uniref:NAD(P)-dependent oxidoreductase n=1 Tax=Sporichthya sp. TaxID=65475 RepID=UPI0018190C8D|nr:NAD(P)-dependent oxidoreductase [Sporichthya sp.]MBA3741364.1 NAD(P)-dependent oxidoreductase [Sporichthya sp.]
MPRIGFIGLGAMGSALAKRLALAGALYVADLNVGAVESLEAEGATGLPATDLAARCEVVMTCLPRSQDVRDLVLGAGGLAAALHPGSVLVDMTTGDPTIDREIAAGLERSGVSFVDAPVSGGPQAAAAGTIAIMVGAAADDFARVRPVLAGISPNITHVGPVGAGHVLKLVNNMLSACNRLAALEAVAIATANGVERATCVAGINTGSGRSYMTEVTFPRFLLDEEIHEQHFQIGLMLKDVGLASSLAESSGVHAPIGELVRRLFADGAVRYGESADINQLARDYL